MREVEQDEDEEGESAIRGMLELVEEEREEEKEEDD